MGVLHDLLVGRTFEGGLGEEAPSEPMRGDQLEQGAGDACHDGALLQDQPNRLGRELG